MSTFDILEHPADIGFRVFGQKPGELFANAALAMVSLIHELDAVSPANDHLLQAEGSDYESLLVNWLNEVLYWADGKQVAFCRFQVNEIEKTYVSGLGIGELRDPARHRSKLIIKAVTYHQLMVAETSEGWCAEVYVDI